MRDRLGQRELALASLAAGATILVCAGDGFVKARANCRECSDEAACRAWFLRRREPAEFCPNAAFFTSLKSET